VAIQGVIQFFWGLRMSEDATIVAFLVKAKKATYAGNGIEAPSSRPNSHDLRYSEGGLLYIDTYVGTERFSGAEALWENDVPLWAMTYSGRIVAEGFSGAFLREALSLVSEDRPYRGPISYQQGPYVYRCKVSGSFDWFSGIEEILRDEVKIYELVFNGGCVK
jgi:Domain of unknown function (DUF5680)